MRLSTMIEQIKSPIYHIKTKQTTWVLELTKNDSIYYDVDHFKQEHSYITRPWVKSILEVSLW